MLHSFEIRCFMTVSFFVPVKKNFVVVCFNEKETNLYLKTVIYPREQVILLLSMLEELVNCMFSMALGTSKQSLLWFSISMYEQNMKENSYKPSFR